MDIPKEIAQKVKIYQEAQAKATATFKEVVAWLNENTDADGVCIEELDIVDQPCGADQGDGEYCDQHAVGWCEDSFEGNYYHPIDGSNQYLSYHYEC